MNADELLAHCPRCKNKLTLDEMGCATCCHCEKEYDEKYGYSYEATAKLVNEVSMPISRMGYEIVILKKGGWEQICGSVTKVNKDEG